MLLEWSSQAIHLWGYWLILSHLVVSSPLTGVNSSLGNESSWRVTSCAGLSGQNKVLSWLLWLQSHKNNCNIHIYIYIIIGLVLIRVTKVVTCSYKWWWFPVLTVNQNFQAQVRTWWYNVGTCICTVWDCCGTLIKAHLVPTLNTVYWMVRSFPSTLYSLRIILETRRWGLASETAAHRPTERNKICTYNNSFNTRSFCS